MKNKQKERLRFFYRQKPICNDKALVEGLFRLNVLQFLPFFAEKTARTATAGRRPGEAEGEKTPARFFIAGFHPLKGEPSLQDFYEKAEDFMVFPVLEGGSEKTSSALSKQSGSKQSGSPSDLKKSPRGRPSSTEVSGEMAFYKPASLLKNFPSDSAGASAEAAGLRPRRTNSRQGRGAGSGPPPLWADSPSVCPERVRSDRVARETVSGAPAFGPSKLLTNDDKDGPAPLAQSLRDGEKIPAAKTRRASGGALRCGPVRPDRLSGEPPLWRRSRLGFAEPFHKAKKVSASDIFLFLVPGLSFDRKGRRLGRGGGFYDRFLPKNPGALKAGVTAAARLHEGDLPEEAHDIRMDIIVTEKFLLFPDITKFCGG